jgi:rhomboid protease GluP
VSPTLATAGYGVLLGTSVWAAGPLEQTGGRRFPVLTAGALLVVGTVSLLQLTAFPALLGTLERDRPALAHGQLWRLVTSLVVQDGGWPGTVFNLAALAVVGTVAESLWSRRRWLAIAATAGIGAQLWGLLVQPSGGGNSVLVFGLAASVLVLALRRGPRPSRVLAVAGLSAGAVLLVGGDLHGGAAALGAAAATFFLRSPTAAPRGAS